MSANSERYNNSTSSESSALNHAVDTAESSPLSSSPNDAAPTQPAASPTDSPPQPSMKSEGDVAMTHADTSAPALPVDEVTGRVKVTLEKPFVYGTAAWWLGQAAVSEGQHSHRWTVFLRGLEHEDLAYLIQSVTFTLHASFDDPVRVLTQAPYQVSETGWGEFVIILTVTFHPQFQLPPVTLNHLLKLFPPAGNAPNPSKPVMSENYDEFVFVEPSLPLYQCLTRGPTNKLSGDDELAPFFTTKEFAKSEHALIVQLAAARDLVHERIKRERHKLWKLEVAINETTADMPTG